MENQSDAKLATNSYPDPAMSLLGRGRAISFQVNSIATCYPCPDH